MPERSFTAGALRVTLDLAPQVLSIDVPEHGACPDALPRGAPRDGGVVSAAALVHKAKQVDDGVRAAVELMAQRGAGPLPARRLLLAALADALAHTRPAARGDAVEVVYAACALGGIEAHVPRALRASVDARIARHRTDPRRAQPMGFHSWSPELALAWNQDRMLQTPLRDRRAVEAVAAALRADPKLRAMYRDHGRLDRRLAGRRVLADLRAVVTSLDGGARAPEARRRALFPAAGSHEQRLVRGLAGEGADVLDALVRAVKSGAVDLTPPPRPSWKDLQLWSLDPLLRPDLTPEAPRLRMGPGYRAHLDELFKAALALTRETHLKQEEEEEECEDGDGPAPEALVVVTPDLAVEPLATLYARMADARRFALDLLDATFGRALDASSREHPWAKPTRSLREELAELESLLRGAAEASRRALGFEPEVGAAPHVARFDAWSRARGRDPDLGEDARAMVPVSFDPTTGRTRVWAFLGWATKVARVHFAVPPRARAERADARGEGAPRVRFAFEAQQVELDVPVVVEAHVRRRLDRDAFRRLCDRHRSVEGIARALART